MQSDRRLAVLSSAVAVTAVALVANNARATLAFDASGNVVETFDSLPTVTGQTWVDDSTTSGAVASLPGWFVQTNLSAGSDGYRRFNRGTGSSNTGSAYNFSNTTGSTDRALGSLASATTSTIWLALRLQNTSNQVINSFTITYDGEQYRDAGNASGAAQSLAFGYRVGAGSIQDAFTGVSELNFESPVHVAAATPATLNGNDPANRVAGITATVSGINWEPGQDLWIRWSDGDSTGSDHGLAIDNLTFSGTLSGAGGGAPTWKTNGSGTWSSGDTSNWLNGNAPTGAGGLVRLGSQITTDSTVTLDHSPTVDSLEINTSAKDYTLAATGGNQLNVAAGGSIVTNGVAFTTSPLNLPTAGTQITAPLNFATTPSFYVNDPLAKMTVTGTISAPSGHGLTLGGPGTVVLPAGFTWSGPLTLDRANYTIATRAQLGDGSVTNTVTLANRAALNVTTDTDMDLPAITGEGLLAKRQAAVVTIDSFRTDAVYIAAADRTGNTSAGILRIEASGGADSGTSVTKFLRFESTSAGGALLGQLDITDNKLIIDYDLSKGNNPLGQTGVNGLPTYAPPTGSALVHSRVAVALWNAYDTADNTHWDRFGITSSLAQNDAQGIHSVGYAEASRLLGLSGAQTATWGGQTVDATSILISYVLAGDTDMNGVVDFDDYARVDRGMAMSAADLRYDGSPANRPANSADRQGVIFHWQDGDFNYDSFVDAADLAILDKTYLALNSAAAPGLLAMRQAEYGDAYVSALVASVPEPAALGMILTAAVPLVGGRRRRQSR